MRDSDDLSHFARTMPLMESPLTQELDDFLDDLPSVLYVDEDSDCVMESEPEPWQDDDTGDWYEPMPCYQIERKAIIEALFGRTFAYNYR